MTMMLTCKHVFAALLCLASLNAFCQNSYLLSLEQRDARRSETMYFYLQTLQTEADFTQPNVLALENALYRIYYFRLREPSASSYFGCSKYADEAEGEALSLQYLLTESELNGYDQTQKAIEAECTALFDNKGRQNSLVTIDFADRTRVKMLKVQFDFCTCKVSRDKFSTISDTLVMPRKLIKTDVFTEAEKAYWQNHVYEVIENTLVRSCLPQPDRYTQVYQVGQR